MRWARIAVAAICLSVGTVGCSAHYVLGLLDSARAPVSSALLAGLSKQDAQSMRDFYQAMSDVVARDGVSSPAVVKTTSDLRTRHRDALSMAFAGTSMVGKYPGLGERLDKYLLEAVGDTDAPMTAAMRESAARAFAAIK